MILEFESTNFYLIVAIIFIVFAAILFFVTEKYKSKIKTLELEKEFLETSLAQNRENQNILKMEIENITSKIFEENSKKSNQNINQILEPFKSQLNIFGNRVNEVFTEETKQRVSLLTEIKNLKELNNQISNDANNLANALKGQSKIQGDWGEMILESILKQSGLRKDLFSFASFNKAFTKSSLLDKFEPKLSAAYSLCLEINEIKGIKKKLRAGENIKNIAMIDDGSLFNPRLKNNSSFKFPKIAKNTNITNPIIPIFFKISPFLKCPNS